MKWTGILTFFLLLSTGYTYYAAESSFVIGKGVYSINGTVKKDAEPYIKNGRTYLPLRYAAYAVGLGDNSIYWEQGTKTAYLIKDKKLISIQIGSPFIQVGDRKLPIDSPAQLYKNRVMIPIRALAEGLDCTVHWDEQDQKVTIIN